MTFVYVFPMYLRIHSLRHSSSSPLSPFLEQSEMGFLSEPLYLSNRTVANVVHEN
jgi:hypothetical protein